MKIQIADETLEFLPQRALFWEQEKLLAFSDVHLGKAESFQSFGIPIPSETRWQDLEQIQSLIAEKSPERILILGDFIHNKESWSEDLFLDLQNFFQQHSSIEWNLILGNHERGSMPFLEKLPLKIHQESLKLAPFLFTHGHLEQTSKLFHIEGHYHPVVTLREGPLKLRFPCFVLTEEKLWIPAFGHLTGGMEVRPQAQQRRFAVTTEEVFEIGNSAKTN